MQVINQNQTYRQISLKRHTTVRIPRGLCTAVEDFLKTEQADRMGFDSKADIVTAAVRNLLMSYDVYSINNKVNDTK